MNALRTKVRSMCAVMMAGPREDCSQGIYFKTELLSSSEEINPVA